MAYYSAPFTFDFLQSRINVDAGTADVDCAGLYLAIKLAQASEEGILHERIGSGSGLVSLGPGVQVGLTIELLGAWQLRFADGNYIARVAGGNLVGGPGGDPIAYSPGVQTLLIQSANATAVTAGGGGAGGGATAAEIWLHPTRSLSAAGNLGVAVAVRNDLGPDIEQITNNTDLIPATL